MLVSSESPKYLHKFLAAYRVGGKNYQKTNRARCGSTGATAPGSVNFLSAGTVSHDVAVTTQPCLASYVQQGDQ